MSAGSAVPSADRPGLGVALMLGFCVTAPLSDAAAKTLAGQLPVMQLVLARFALQAAVLVPLALLMGDSLRMSRLGLGLTALRTALQIAGIWLMVTGLTYLPLAEAIAIAFVMPFILLLAGHLVLGETVGPVRLWACAAGFAGTLMVMQPSFAEVGWPVLYPLGVAVVFAAFMLVTRRLAREAGAIAMQAVSGVMGVAALGLAYGVLPRAGLMELVDPGTLWPLLVLMAALGSGGHLLMTWSLRFAPAATVAPMQYLEIPVAAVIGLLVFGDFPNPLALAGIGVTIAAGVFILWREARVKEART